MKKGKKIMMVFLTGVASFFLLLMAGVFLVAFITGKGEIEPSYDEDGEILEGSVAEKIFVKINGRENGMIIRGKSEDNPVLLFISGGPGVPQYWLNEYYDNKIEDYFTVCWWDYYGEGLSYDASMKGEDITLEQLQQDAVCVAEYLKNRFGKEKVYLMAHSAGSVLGLRLAQNCPEQFYCYFAMGQKAGSRYESGYLYMKDFFEETNNKKGLRLLEKHIEEKDGEIILYNRKGLGADWEKALLMAGCATTREMRSDCFEIFFPQIFSRCYTIKEKVDYWRGKALCQNSAYADEKIEVKNEAAVKIPIYFISGRYDYTCPVTLTEDLYYNLDAPEKALYIFEDSAHSPLWEENEAVLEVMLQER